ncbi:MAG: histidinol dehydrogenase [Firmicutes bacterium]|nr:histidinol dehydrogenase [Bacillota bacterium]
MIEIRKLAKENLSAQIPMRSQFEYEEVNQSVKAILDDVSRRGDEALKDYNMKFDHADTPELEIPKEEWIRASRRIDPELLKVIQEAADNIRAYHEKQKRQSFFMQAEKGTLLGQMILPIEKVGIYVPGGTAAYPSTVLMNAIPAKIAGVRELVLVSPPGYQNSIPDAILAAAYVAGVDRVYRIGGAQAIAALAFGTESVPAVSKIVGPGNIYVAMAKKMVFGKVAIDMIAGPSEVMVVADEQANPAWVAADLLSQAEHDKLACAILVTNSQEIAEKTALELDRQVKLLPRFEIAGASLENYGRIFVTDTIEEAIELANEIAPEHLEIYTKDPMNYLSLIKNAGSVFLGAYTTEPLGDYLAGPNHTLPTSGTAKFASALSVDDFVKKTQVSYFTKEGMLSVADDVAVFARAEGLEAHARAALIRKDKENG